MALETEATKTFGGGSSGQQGVKLQILLPVRDRQGGTSGPTGTESWGGTRIFEGMGPGGTMSVTPLGVSSGPRECSARPHELSTSTELRVVRQPPSGVSRRREALAVAVPTLLLGLAVALVD